jgi:hypothetical protein
MTIRDGNWELLEWDAATGRTVWVWFDGEKTHVRTDYPVASLIEQNTARRNAAVNGWKGDWHHIASIPLNLLHDENTGLHKALVAGDDKHVSRFLNDSDNAAWRTKEGRV